MTGVYKSEGESQSQRTSITGKGWINSKLIVNSCLWMENWEKRDTKL